MRAGRHANELLLAIAASVALAACEGDDSTPTAPGETIVWQSTDLALVDPVMGIAVGVGGDLIAGTRSNGVFRSTDEGSRWVRSDAGITDPFIRAVAANADGIVFTGTESGGVFRSTDRGVTWTAAGDGLPGGVAVTSLAVSNAQTLFAGTAVGIFRSRDEGRSWTSTSVGSSTRSICGAPNSFVYAATNEGVYRSTSDGDFWDLLLGESSTSVGVNTRGEVFVGIEGGVFRSVDAGRTFQLVEFTGALVWFVAADPFDQLYAGTFDVFGLFGSPPEGVFRSRDSGESWSDQNEGLTDLSAISIAFDPGTGRAFLGTSRGVFRSSPIF